MELIDRDALYEAFDSKYDKDTYGYAFDLDATVTRREILKFIKSFPSAHPEQKKGKWIKDEFGSRCERCGLYAYRDKFDRPWESDFCPNCGADMRNEDNLL